MPTGTATDVPPLATRAMTGLRAARCDGGAAQHDASAAAGASHRQRRSSSPAQSTQWDVSGRAVSRP